MTAATAIGEALSATHPHSPHHSPPGACRDQLKRHYNLGQYWLVVELGDLSSFDAQLADKLSRLPSEFMPMVGWVCSTSRPFSPAQV